MTKLSNGFIVEEYSSKISDDESDLESNNSIYDEQQDSDAELQDALLSGKLKPGLHAKLPFKPKLIINNVDTLKSKLNDFKLNLNWIERLDLISNVDELPDNIPNPLKDQNLKSETNDLDVVRNDIKREIKFMLQAKSSALQGLERLHALKVKTKRPDDYFAEMIKTKEHMDKIKKVKDQKQEVIEKKEKAKQLREQKKMSKKIQHEVLRQRQKDKKEFQEKVKKFRKGNLETTDFLDEKKNNGKGGKFKNNKYSGNKNQSKTGKGKLSKKEFKQSKFGFGGRKKGLKRNTKESSASMESFGRSSFKKSNNKSKKKFRK